MKLDRRQSLMIAGAATLALAAGTFLNLPDAGVGAAHAQSVEKLMEPQPLPDMVMGDANAPVTIVEYASMTCPHCAQFHTATLPAIKEKYIDTGKAKTDPARIPVRPACCCGVHARPLRATGNSITRWSACCSNSKRHGQPQRTRLSRCCSFQSLPGFTQEVFEACLKNQELLDKVRAVFEKGSKEYGVESTPTFFINGEKTTGALSVEEMSKLIDKHL